MTSHLGKIQAVVFDIDDSLYPEQQFVRSGYHAVACRLREQLGRDDLFEDWLWQRFLQGKVAGAFNDLSEAFSLALDDAEISQLVEIYRFHQQPDITPFDGIAELLTEIRKTRRMGIVSDGPALMQRNKLRALGLENFFEAVGLTDNLGADAGKPNPAGFEYVQQTLGVPHESCVYVSDNPSKDFLAPNRLGWLTIQYRRPGQLYADKPSPPGGDAQLIIHNDNQLLAAISP
ncbi:MAG: HAD family hydrolase [Phycisphaerae bacterium]|nr:HAD family hydrolase [Phycisphaerae bacterium]